MPASRVSKPGLHVWQEMDEGTTQDCWEPVTHREAESMLASGEGVKPLELLLSLKKEP